MSPYLPIIFLTPWLDLKHNITTGHTICCLVNVSPDPFFRCNPRSEMAGKIHTRWF